MKNVLNKIHSFILQVHLRLFCTLYLYFLYLERNKKLKNYYYQIELLENEYFEP